MRNLNKLISITLCSALLLTNVTTKADAASKPSVTKRMTLTVGQSKTIKVKGTVKKKSFKSKNKKIATVTKKGKVTAKKTGTCKVTVTIKYKKGKKLISKKYTCNVTVNEKQDITQTEQPIETEKASVTVVPVNTDNPSVSKSPDETTTPVTKEPDGTQKPIVSPTPTATPEITPTVDETMSPSEAPSKTPIVSDEPIEETSEPSTPDVDKTPTPTPTESTGIIGKPDVPTTPDTPQRPVTTPTVGTKEPTTPNVSVTPSPSVPTTPDVPDETPSTNEGPSPTPNSGAIEPPIECEHEIGDVWNVVYNRILTPICKNCNKKMSKYQISFEYKGEQYTYTRWNPEPSETTEGILDVYQGVNIYDMTQEELEQKYEKFNVVFSDGRTDTFYGKWINNIGEPTDDRDEAIHFGVYAKSTAEKIGSITYPKYEVKTIDLGNGETTKVYGYYDREMADEVFRLLNEYRVENGLNELEYNDITQSFADIRSAETFYTEIYNQQNTDYEYQPHERPNKTMYDTVIGDLYAAYGENIIVSTLIEDYQAGGLLQKVEMTPENIMQNFKNSLEHNAIMLHPDVTDLAVSIFIGYPQNKDGTFRSYKVAIPVQSFMY